MDKYEYRIKADQIKKLVNEGDYISAMKLADTIDWRRVKNVSMLCTVSDIYEKNAKYEESHELLLMAYDRSPIGRMMVYKLAELAIKMEDYEEAIDYYREFVHLSPGDIAADILKYKIYKAKGTSPEELIPIMEAFKEKEYHEEWAYELAHLYHEAGMGSKCVEECDEIILWFSEGKFVERAMELKMLYRPLTPEQQEKYDNRFEIKEDVTSYYDEEEDEDSNQIQEMIDSSKIQVITEDMFSDEVDPNDITIKPVNLGKYDTINLQAELAKSMEQIMSATEKEAVDSTMENIRKLVEDSQILDINFDDELEKNEILQENIQVEIPAQMEVAVDDKKEKKTSFDKVLAEERDGQISLYMPEANILEKQITGQIKIEDVLKEWDRMKSAAELAIKEAELKRLNEAKSKALQKAENIMSKLSLIISEEEMKVNGQEIAAAIEASFLEEDEALAQVAASLEKDRESNLNLKELSQDEIRFNTDMIDISKELEALEDLNSEDELPIEAEETKEAKELEEESTPDNEIEDSNKSIDETKDNSKEKQSEVIEDEMDDTSNLSTNIEAILADELETSSDEYQEEENKQVIAGSKGLTKEQSKAFAAFLSVRGVEKSLNAVFDSINEASSAGIPFDVGFIAVLGNEKTGKTTLAMEIAKEIQIAQHKKSAKVAKISANTLNTKDIKQLANKMEGGVLIIEKAGNLTEKTIKNMMSTIREANEEILLILEDTKSGIETVLSKDTDFANRVTNRIELPEYNNDELVEFGKDYANTLMYTIDDMAILALYTCLGNIQKDEEALTIDQVKEIIDKAIEQSNKKKLKKLKDIIMKRRYDEEKRVILLEEDFENIM